MGRQLTVSTSAEEVVADQRQPPLPKHQLRVVHPVGRGERVKEPAPEALVEVEEAVRRTGSCSRVRLFTGGTEVSPLEFRSLKLTV